MGSIMRAVEKEVSRKPFVQYGLSKDLINCSALAKQILPKIEKELGKKVKPYTVIVTLHRISEKIRLKERDFAYNFGSELNLKNNLFEATFERTSSLLKKLQKIYEQIDYGKGHYINVLQGSYEISIIMNHAHERMLFSLLKGERILKVEKRLCALTLRLDKDFVDTPAVLFTASRQLAWDGVNIFELLSTLTELTFIVSEDDSAMAYASLKELLAEKK